MQGGEKLSLEQIRAFLSATEEAQFDGQSTAEVYAWVTRVLTQHGYNKQKRAVKGLLRQYVAKMTGLSRAQTTRLIGQYAECCEVKMKTYSRHRFASALGNRYCDSHIPAGPRGADGKVEIQKQDSHFSTARVSIGNPN